MLLSTYKQRVAAVEYSFHSEHREARKNYTVKCPLCVSSKTGQADFSLSIDKATGFFICHRCEFKGRTENLFAVDELPEQQQRQLTIIEPPQGYVPLSEVANSVYYGDAIRYARKRHLTDKLIDQLRVGVCIEGYYSGRLIIPLLDECEQWLGFFARDYTGKANKPHLYSVGLPRGEFFYNNAAVDELTDKPLLVVEGIFDAVPFLPDAVAMLGKITEQQKINLLHCVRPVILCYDGDAWGESQALCRWLRFNGKLNATYIRLPPKKDPDEMINFVTKEIRNYETGTF